MCRWQFNTIEFVSLLRKCLIRSLTCPRLVKEEGTVIRSHLLEENSCDSSSSSNNNNNNNDDDDDNISTVEASSKVTAGRNLKQKLYVRFIVDISGELLCRHVRFVLDQFSGALISSCS